MYIEVDVESYPWVGLGAWLTDWDSGIDTEASALQLLWQMLMWCCPLQQYNLIDEWHSLHRWCLQRLLKHLPAFFGICYWDSTLATAVQDIEECPWLQEELWATITWDQHMYSWKVSQLLTGYRLHTYLCIDCTFPCLYLSIQLFHEDIQAPMAIHDASTDDRSDVSCEPAQYHRCQHAAVWLGWYPKEFKPPKVRLCHAVGKDSSHCVWSWARGSIEFLYACW